MSSTELDLPVLVTPEQIRRREFVTTRRGYDVEQVRNYLEHLSRQVEQMEAMLRTAKLRAAGDAQTGPRLDPYEQLSRRFAEVMRATDREADRIRREARDEAERILHEARADADRVRVDAQSRAERAREEAEDALREARMQADKTISGLATRRNTLVEQLATMQERLLEVAHELQTAIEHPEGHTELLASLEAWSSGVEGDEGGRATGAAEPPAEADHPAEGAEAAATDEPAPAASPDPQGRRPPEDSATPTTVINVGADPPTVEELWTTPDPDELRLPEIPELDLGWDDDRDDDRD